MRTILGVMAIALALTANRGAYAEPGPTDPKPTIVLVHGAFADASSWSGVITRLKRDGFEVVAAANPLRGVASDTASVSSVVKSIPGPVLLVGHSYGGPVITSAANGAGLEGEDGELGRVRPFGHRGQRRRA